jgi:signal transduction histidine kinase/DNA-binding response OmpR family regulator
VLDKNRVISGFYPNANKNGSLSDVNVLCFLEDSKGRIWVGTRGGLNLFNPQTKTFQLFTKANGLPDNIIFNILEDKNHALWVSTPKGLCEVILETKEKDIQLSVINYDEKNALQNIEFNEKAALKTQSGELIFGGPSGFNIIDPDKIQKSAYRPKIVFTELQILNNTVEPGESINNRILLPQSLSFSQNINLKYIENVFTIEFASTDFAHGEYERYAYMMEGFNSDWLYTTGNMRRATYTNLTSGHYIFKVKVLNRNGIWSDVKTLHINIQPPFWLTNVAYIIYFLLTVGLLLLIRRITLERIHMRYEVAQQKKEVERAFAMEQLKTKFFTNVSHEFRTPLSLIISPLDNIIQHASDEEQKVQLSLVQRNAKRLLNLVNQLLDFRKMEVQSIKLYASIGDIVSFCRDISQSFTDIVEKKRIQFAFSSNIDELEIFFDKDKIEKILLNLLSNAFKYTYDNGKVSINLIYSEPKENETDGKLAIEVKDNGIGIPADKHTMIFERFFQTDVPESMVNQGVGIGLAITKEFVKLHGGVITVKSEPDAGTCFTVLLPAKKIYVSNNHLATKPILSEEIEDIELKDNFKKEKKTILVVEDNEDLRFYLKENLKKLYHIEEAVNGKEGWEKVKSLDPDIVVSDIMMPVMDGIELAKKIKNETQTSHIPIILLTAMGSEEKQMEGYNIGVNDYITKPFIFDILVSRIKNLIAQQKLLQKKFHKQIEVNPAEITITPVDEKFLKSALEIVEKHIDEPGFSVEDFSHEIFMNRVTLYRKILSLTGKTPIEFIRSIRLKRAAQLLEKSGKSIAEIAYEVGFNNPKHFSKFFKEEFDVLPSLYNKNGKSD